MKEREKTEQLHHPPLMFNHLNINQYQTRRSIQNIHQSISSPPITVSLPSTHTLSLFTLSYTHTYISSPSATCPLTPKQTNKQTSLSLSLSPFISNYFGASFLPRFQYISLPFYNKLSPPLSFSLSSFFFFFFFPGPTNILTIFRVFGFGFGFHFPLALLVNEGEGKEGKLYQLL